MQLYGFSRSRRRFLLGFLLCRSRRGFGHRRGSRGRGLFGRSGFGCGFRPGGWSRSRRGLFYFRSSGGCGRGSRLRLLHRRHLRLFGCGSRFGLVMNRIPLLVELNLAEDLEAVLLRGEFDFLRFGLGRARFLALVRAL